MDVTDHPELGMLNANKEKRAWYLKPLTEELKAAIKSMLADPEINDAHLRKDLTKLSSFWNRSYRSPWGLLSSDWIYERVGDVSTQSFLKTCSILLTPITA